MTTRDFRLWPGLDTTYTITRPIVSQQTPFQSLEICDTAAFGRALQQELLAR